MACEPRRDNLALVVLSIVPLARARWVVLFSPARIAENETVLEVEYPPLTEPRPPELQLPLQLMKLLPRLHRPHQLLEDRSQFRAQRVRMVDARMEAEDPQPVLPRVL